MPGPDARPQHRIIAEHRIISTGPGPDLRPDQMMLSRCLRTDTEICKHIMQTSTDHSRPDRTVRRGSRSRDKPGTLLGNPHADPEPIVWNLKTQGTGKKEMGFPIRELVQK